MIEEITEIISILKEKNPDASEGEIKKAIIDLINSNLSEIVAKTELPPLKELEISSRKEIYRQARSRVKSEKLQEDRSRIELVRMLTAFQEEFSDRGLKEDADRFTKHIKPIEWASSTKKEALMYADSDLSEGVKREENAEEDRSRNIKRKLEELEEAANE